MQRNGNFFFYFLGKIHVMRVNCQLEFCVFQVTHTLFNVYFRFQIFFINNFCKI